MQCYLRWSEHARSLDHFTTLISADVDGGFDKVDPSLLSQTHLNPLYAHWIRHWASNRIMQFRPNHRLDPQKYITNNGIPQGSPLSPFLFGAHIKSLMDPRQITTPAATRLVISYVDDVLICVSADSRQSVETLARSTWASLNAEANHINMSFAENKTKTLHDRLETWGIGSTVNQLRFLGYWLETPPPDERTHPPSYTHHLRHWTTKANYALNMLRALTLRSDRGLRSSAILRILDACVRSILLYGIKFWGSHPDLVQAADAFIYGALRNLFDLPIATPHRPHSPGSTSPAQTRRGDGPSCFTGGSGSHPRACRPRARRPPPASRLPHRTPPGLLRPGNPGSPDFDILAAPPQGPYPTQATLARSHRVPPL